MRDCPLSLTSHLLLWHCCWYSGPTPAMAGIGPGLTATANVCTAVLLTTAPSSRFACDYALLACSLKGSTLTLRQFNPEQPSSAISLRKAVQSLSMSAVSAAAVLALYTLSFWVSREGQQHCNLNCTTLQMVGGSHSLGIAAQYLPQSCTPGWTASAQLEQQMQLGPPILTCYAQCLAAAG